MARAWRAVRTVVTGMPGEHDVFPQGSKPLYGFASGGAFFTYDFGTKASQAVNGQTGLHFNGAGSTTCAPQL